MILQALVKEYENLAQKGLVSKPGWSQAKVSYAIDLNADGSIKVIYSLQTEDQRGKKIVMRCYMCRKWLHDLPGLQQIFCVIMPNICLELIQMEQMIV